MSHTMDDTEVDDALVASAFEQAGLRGWRALSIADAARDADLPLARVRARFVVVQSGFLGYDYATAALEAIDGDETGDALAGLTGVRLPV